MTVADRYGHSDDQHTVKGGGRVVRHERCPPEAAS